MMHPVATFRTTLLVVVPVIAFVVVMLAVTSALEDVIFFSLFVGIPSGLVSAVAVWVVLHVLLRPERGSV